MLMKCHTNINSTPFTHLPHKFSYIVAMLGHNHFESPNTITAEYIQIRNHKNMYNVVDSSEEIN
jgi:hypothetical protein